LFGAGKYDAQHLVVIKELPIKSSWVESIHLVMWEGEPVLAVTFKDGACCLYPATTETDYHAMVVTGSKGKFVWNNLYNLSYHRVALRGKIHAR